MRDVRKGRVGEAERVREVKMFGVSGVENNEGEGGREES
jgi:hypothetical protein